MNENNLCPSIHANAVEKTTQSHKYERKEKDVTNYSFKFNSKNVPKLYNVSEVESQLEVSSCLVETLEWVKSFLAKPHKDLGRNGPVCPFVPTSLITDKIWFAEVTDETISVEGICDIITRFREVFLDTEPTNSADAINKSILIVFPKLADGGAEVVDEVQLKLKQDFVCEGLMLGEFHSNNESPGLRNDAFRPLRSPIPMIAIRHMVDTDLPFLSKASYPSELRGIYIKAYLTNLYNSLSRSKFEEALEYLIEAELQLSQTCASDGSTLSNIPA